MAKISIPRSENPLRMQASLGGSNIYRAISESDGNSFLVQGVVTKVYYQKGTIDFSVINEASVVQDGEGNDGTQSAPIPVDFFGSNAEGQVYGHYRPVQTGSNIVVAYLKGKKANPIVVGVYPKSTDDYELISPATQNTADDNDPDVQDIVLGEKHVYPSGQILYRTGSGNIMESMNGKSFMAITQDSMEYYDDIWHTYDAVGCFYDNDANKILSKQTLAGSWVLVHEDNNQSDDSADGHMTRFYVNNYGKFQIVFGNYNDSSNLVVLEGSKDDGILMSKLFDTNNLQDTSSDYVTMNVGKDHTISLKSATMTDSVAQSSTFEVKSDDIYVNGKKLSSYVGGTIDIEDALNKSDSFNDLKKITANAANSANEASTKAEQAGEDAKDAAVTAEQAGEDAKAQSKDIKDKIIYYTSISPESAGDYYVPGKFLHLTELTFIDDALIKTAMIQDEAVDTSKIANLAVGSAQMEDLAVTREKIGNLAVGTAQIEDLAVTDAKVGTLSFVHMAGQTLDANEINVVNLTGDNIKVGTITADKLIITSLGDITSNLGKVTSGEINAGTDSSSGVVINNLPADQPDVYTAQKKVALKQQIALIESEANSAIDYGTQTGNDTTQLMTDKTALLSGTSGLLSDITTTSNFDHTKIDTWLANLRKDIDDFQASVNSSLSAKISETANGKNSIYTGTQAPSSPQENDIWIKDNGNGTTTIQVYGNGSWYTPSDQALKSVAAQVELLPKSYYSSTQPSGTDYKDGDLWYKISTNAANNTVVYTPYKWNHDTNSWDPMLDISSSHNYVGSAPASPAEGDFWMDDAALKQYQKGSWVTIPTEGPQGIAGTSTYIHVAYATSSDGKIGFSTTSFDGAVYIGVLTDSNEKDSTTYTDYTWSRMKGLDGTDGTDGIQGPAGTDGKTTYVHFAYANSSDGKTGFNVVYFDNAEYIGTYTDFTEADSTTYTDYTWSRLKGDTGADGDVGPKGDQGLPGENGSDGKSSYTHIAYATSSTGSGFTQTPSTSTTHIGMYVDQIVTDSNDPTKYAWSLIKGADGTNGAPGKAGADGKTPYFHIAYADSSDGNTNFSLDTPGSRKYIGNYTDFTQADSTNPAAYSWQLVQGPQGDTGADGVAGKDGVGIKSTAITYALGDSGTATPTTGWTTSVPSLVKGQYLWTKTVWTYTDNSFETGYSVTYISKDGNNGNDGLAGKDGTGIKTTTITYAGSTSGTTAPTSGWTSTVPTVAAGSYLWTKTVWAYTDNTSETGYSVAMMGVKGDTGDRGLQGLQGPKGDQGIKGPDGVDGRTTYAHFAYANSQDGKTDFSTTDSNRKYIGFYSDFSSGDSTDQSKYNWSLIKGADGADGKDGVPGPKGADGKTPYFHIAYADSSDGNTNFSLDTAGSRKYIGNYTDFTQADSTNPAAYSWQLVQGPKGDTGVQGIQGPKGDTGATGAQGTTTYTWIKYATDSSGSNMSDSPTNMTYLGIAYNKTTSSESSTATDYKWSLIKGGQGIPGKTGADGKTSYFHIAYANSSNGSIGFTTNPSTSASYNYMGTYSDYTSTSSTSYSSYKWVAMFDSTKKRNFTTQPTTPYAVGDTWTQSGATYFCTTARNSGAFTASDWTMQQLTIQSLDSSVTNSLYNDNLLMGTDPTSLIKDNGTSTTDNWVLRSGGDGTSELIETPDRATQHGFQINGNTTGNKAFQQYATFENEVYTFSIYAKITSSDASVKILLRVWGDSGWLGSSSPMLTSTSWTKLTWVIDAAKFDLVANPNPLMQFGLTNVGSVAFAEPKLEKGSIATPWCLSQSEITTTTGSYKGVTLNDTGLTATAGSTTVAMNSTDGFLINNDKGQVFHVDTAGNLTMQGDITAGNISGVNFTGNSLNLATTLNVTGSISASSGNTVINSSGLTIRGGNLSIQDSSGNQTTYLQSDGTFVGLQGDFKGTVTTSALIVTGSNSDINLGGGKFHVDKDGNLTAKSATLADGTINSSVINGSQFLVGNEYYSPLERSTHNALSATNIGLRTGTSFSREANLATVSNSINDNYLLKTGNPIRFVGKGEADNGSDTSATSSTKYYQVVNSNVYGKLVTISVTYTISNAIPSNGTIQLQQYSNPNWNQYCILPGGTAAGTHTITQTVTLPTVSSSNTDNVSFRGETRNYTGDVIISHVKLELGSEATPWNASESDNGANAQISGIPNIISPLTDADDLLWKSYNHAELYGLNSYDTTPTAQTIDASWPSNKYIVHVYNDWGAMHYTSPSGEVFKAGQTYTVAFRARTRSGTKTTGLNFSIYATTSSINLAIINNPTITPQFTWYQASFTLTSDVAIDNFRIEPHGDWGNTGGSVYLCDMSIIKGNIVYGVDLRFPFKITSQNPTDISVTPVTIDTRNLSSGRTLIITTEVLYNNNYSSIGGTIQVQIGDTIKSILAQKYSIINGYETFTYSIDWNDNYQVGSNVPVTLLFSSLESGSIFVNYVNAYSTSTTLDTNTPISDSYGYVTPYGELRLGYSTTSTNADNNNMLSDTSSLSYYGGILKLENTNYDTISANGINYRTDLIQGGYTTNQSNGDVFYSSSIDALGLYYNKTSYDSNITSKGVTWNWDEIANSAPSGIGMGGVGGDASWFDTRDGFDVYPNLISNSSFLDKLTNWSIHNGRFYWSGGSFSDGCFCVGFNNGGGDDSIWQHIYTFPDAGGYLTLSFWAFCWDSDTSTYGSHGMQLNFEQSNGTNNTTVTFKMSHRPVSQKWTRYTFSPIEITSTMASNLDHLSIMFHTDNANGHWMFARPMLNIGSDPKPYKFT